MLKVTSQQREQLARAIFIQKMDALFLRDVPNFADLPEDNRREFLTESIFAAQANGLITEQGIASYARGVWWLGPDFERAIKMADEADLRACNGKKGDFVL